MSKAHKDRLAGVVLAFTALGLLVWGRLVWLQLVGAGRYLALAHQQHQLVVELPASRGTIYDRHLQPLATDIRLPSLYADPRWVPHKARVTTALAPILGLPPSAVSAQLHQRRGFVWLARKTSNRAAQAVQALRIPGVDMVKEPRRVYPGGALASHVVGFAGLDHRGLEGLELALDPWLRGRSGWRWAQRDAKQRHLEAWRRDVLPARAGTDVVLTIDQVIQHVAEQALRAAYDTHQAHGASIVVLQPRTGEILAMASCPSYDPNAPGRAATEARRNRAVTDTFEPGSVFKIVTAAALLNDRVIAPTDRLYCEQGEFPIHGRILHDVHPHGWLTFREVIENSSNIGTAKAAMKLAPDRLYHYIRAFGFGQATGAGLPGEVIGVTKPPARWSKPSRVAIPMGQEVTVTALQLAVLAATIANDGVMMRPWLIQAVQDAEGRMVQMGRPEVVRQVIAPAVAAELKAIMAGAIERGTGKQAAVAGYRVAGKTGTAQKVEGGVYSHRHFVASFVGFAPVDDPQLAIVVMVDNPHPYYYGGVVAAPVFAQVVGQILPYLEQRPQPEPR
ncbi:MAG: penicillin-binding protein 2, partial [Candidatus Omnitrophica bacterium]|nr:penicillin-binding protein 2 [Candidatus Omnitrophota bacterium]